MDNIPTLTTEQIQTLQVDATLRLLGEYSRYIVQLNQEICEAIVEAGQAKIKLDCLKNQKSTLLNTIRALKVVAEKA